MEARGLGALDHRTRSLGLHEGQESLPVWFREEFVARGQILNVLQGQSIINQGAVSSEVYYIISGKIQFSLYSMNGKQTILSEMAEDQIFGELSALDGQKRSAAAVTIEKAVLASLTAQQFHMFLAEVPGAGYWIALQMSAHVRRLTDRTFQLTTMPVSARVQNEILQLGFSAGVTNDESVIHRLPTHSEFASLLGTHREGVTRELRQLASEGIIVQTGRRLKIVSVRRLQALLKRFQG